MSNALEGLRQAVGVERADDKTLRQSYYQLVHQIAAYEYGVGPSPTVDDFLKWRCRAEARKAASFSSGEWRSR